MLPRHAEGDDKENQRNGNGPSLCADQSHRCRETRETRQRDGPGQRAHNRLNEPTFLLALSLKQESTELVIRYLRRASQRRRDLEVELTYLAARTRASIAAVGATDRSRLSAQRTIKRAVLLFWTRKSLYQRRVVRVQVRRLRCIMRPP